MQNEHKNNLEKRKSQSFVINGLNSVFLLIYSFFARCGLIRQVSSNDKLYDDDVIVGALKPKATASKKRSFKADSLLEGSKSLNVIGKLGAGLAHMSVNVYGVFFFVYSLISIFMFYVKSSLNGQSVDGASTILTATVILICSIPMVFTSKSALSAVSGSNIARRIVLTVFAVPEEKLRSKKTYGGSEYVFTAVVLAILLGIFTYFLHPAYVPALVGILLAICIVFANPEACVLVTIAVTPFLQYTKNAENILVLLIAAGLISYFDKLVRKKRTRYASIEGIFIVLICGFILVSGIFSVGGADTFMRSVNTALTVAGGFFLTYNLIRGENKLNTAIKILLVSFSAICLSGIWNMFYNAFVAQNIYSLHEEVAPIFENNVIYIADSASVFSVMSVLLMPLLFANVAKRKSFKGKALALVLAFIAIVAAYIYGSYEAVIAISVECLIFLVLYSHKTLTAIFVALIPISICILIYPYFMTRFGLPSFPDVLRSVLPLNAPESEYRAENIECVWNIIRDGNWSGIGVGDSVLNVYYRAYSDSVSVGLIGTGNVWMQVLCWSGIGGLASLTVGLILICLKSLGHIIRSEKSAHRADMLALFCGVIGSLLLGSVSCLWNDIRMLYLFFVCSALLAVYSHEYRRKERQRCLSMNDYGDSKDFEFRNRIGKER